MRHPLPAVPPDSCRTCRTGCGCKPADPGCGHYGCWGSAPLSCPTALRSRAEYEERLEATRRLRAVYASRRARWRSQADAVLLTHLLP